MAVIAKPLFQGTLAAAAETNMYAAPAGTRTIIDKLTAMNTSAASATITVKIVANGGSAGALNTVVSKSLVAGESYTFPEIVGHVLNAGDFISILAGTAAVLAVRASGREVT